MERDFQEYVEAMSAENWPLFDRLHRLILEACPEAVVGISYDMPTYTVGRNRLHMATWSHGVSLYGWRHSGGDSGFAERHPELISGRGTIRLRPSDAAAIPDDEFRALARAALTP